MTTTENGKPTSNQVHFILQGKGGVGKSLVSAILGQYFHARKATLHCFDTDPVNATFAQYEALAAEHIKVLRRGAIHDKRFDELIEKICQFDGICIVDTGATTFVPLWNYILEKRNPVLPRGPVTPGLRPFGCGRRTGNERYLERSGTAGRNDDREECNRVVKRVFR